LTAVTPAAPHQRFCANGRSRLIVQISTSLPSFAASWLNRRVSVSQVGVSSEGTELRITTLPFASLSLTGLSPLSSAVKSGAFCPVFTSEPPSVIGLPRRVT
jgi:hypothetical protein